mmetsp:Transcript_27329/g.57242  ORF Transcript_27329/g.57242 Transcript_27329/m.57242 type:complete len:252 (+) Transcript_27329:352-1107(+)
MFKRTRLLLEGGGLLKRIIGLESLKRDSQREAVLGDKILHLKLLRKSGGWHTSLVTNGSLLFRKRTDAADGVKIGLVVRVRHQTASIATRGHVLEKVLHSTEEAFVVVTVSINSTSDMLETVVVKLTQERTEAIVRKVLLQHSGLFKALGDGDLESAAVREPLDALGIAVVAKDIIDFLRKAHLLNRSWRLVLHVGRDLRKVSVRMVNIGLGLLDNLDHTRFNWIVVFDLLETGFALLLGSGVVLCGRGHG